MNEVANILLQAAQQRGFTPEELARQATDKIISVGDKSHPVIRDQAQAFRAHIQAVLTQTLHDAVAADRTTLAHRFRAAGFAELVPLLKD